MYLVGCVWKVEENKEQGENPGGQEENMRLPTNRHQDQTGEPGAVEQQHDLLSSTQQVQFLCHFPFFLFSAQF